MNPLITALIRSSDRSGWQLMRQCHRCKRELPISEFCRCSKRKDGLDIWCRECKNVYGKEYKRRVRRDRWLRNLSELDRSLPKPSDKELAYFGGIIDGEGSFIAKIYPNTDSLYLDFHISNTNHKLAGWLIEKVGGHTGDFSVKPNQKPAYKWKLSRDEARLIIPKVLPYLVLKKRHAEIYIELLYTCGMIGRHSDKNNMARRSELVNELLRLNKKGVVV